MAGDHLGLQSPQQDIALGAAGNHRKRRAPGAAANDPDTLHLNVISPFAPRGMAQKTGRRADVDTGAGGLSMAGGLQKTAAGNNLVTRAVAKTCAIGPIAFHDHSLVTGAAGFIGYHLATRLLNDGRRVIGIDSFTPYYDVALKRARWERLEGRDGFARTARRYRRQDIVLFAPVRLGIQFRRTSSHLAAQPGGAVRHDGESAVLCGIQISIRFR